MASSFLAVRRATAAALFNRQLAGCFHSASSVASVARSFNTNAQISNYDDDCTVDVDCRPDRSVSRRRDSVPSFFSGQVNIDRSWINERHRFGNKYINGVQSFLQFTRDHLPNRPPGPLLLSTLLLPPPSF